MKKIYFIYALILTLLAFAGCQNQQKNNRDAEMTQAVQQRLAQDERLASAGIKVRTEDGIVTLSGTVIGEEEADRALDVAHEVPSVQFVHSELKVDTQITDADVEKRLDNQEEVNEQSQTKNTDAGTAVDDAEITAKVKVALARDDILSAYRIEVDTTDGSVTLTGKVKSDSEAQRAIQLAESVDNVKRVVSVLKLIG